MKDRSEKSKQQLSSNNARIAYLKFQLEKANNEKLRLEQQLHSLLSRNDDQLNVLNAGPGAGGSGGLTMDPTF